MTDIGTFAGIAVALYAGHHVGDYWVQTDHQAQHKGRAGHEGQHACLRHVLSYTLTQSLFVALVIGLFDLPVEPMAMYAGMFVSGVTHYMADRREFGIMFKLARLLPGKEKFLTLGVPRANRFVRSIDEIGEEGSVVPMDNPSLGTGAWALDQSWHIFWGVFVAGLIICI